MLNWNTNQRNKNKSNTEVMLYRLAKLRGIWSCVLIRLWWDRALLHCRKNVNICTHSGKSLAAALNGFINVCSFYPAILYSWGYALERIPNRLVRSHIYGLLQCCLWSKELGTIWALTLVSVHNGKMGSSWKQWTHFKCMDIDKYQNNNIKLN